MASTPVNPQFTPDPLDPSYVPPSPAPDPAAQPQPAAQDEWFVAAETGTRYRTAEEAARGIAEKDRMIAQYQQQMRAAAQAFGVGPQPQAEPTYLDLMEQAIQQNNPALYQQAVQRDIDTRAAQLFQQQFAPYQSLLSQAALQTATEAASSGPKGDPNISTFVRGGGLEKFKAEHPELGEVLTIAQQSPQLHSKLPGLLRDAYRIASAGAPAAPAAPGNRTPPASTTPATPLAPTTDAARRNWLLDQPLEQILG